MRFRRQKNLGVVRERRKEGKLLMVVLSLSLSLSLSLPISLQTRRRLLIFL
jgi:hypothetical protein